MLAVNWQYVQKESAKQRGEVSSWHAEMPTINKLNNEQLFAFYKCTTYFGFQAKVPCGEMLTGSD